MKQLFGSIIISFCALTSAAIAQEKAEQVDAAVANTEIAKETETGPAATGQGTLQSAISTEPTATKTPTNNANRAATAPGTYNPSEEISDDLSVSFPVDI